MSITQSNRAKWATKFNLMSEIQRNFLLSQIKQKNPKNIIEIGVYAGGATHFMYEATRESEAKILSVDINKQNYSFSTGFVMEKINDQRLRREYGKDVSELCKDFDKSGEKFDFLVLDTMHVHPVESLNFLTILPYLTKDATVVLHDIALFTHNEKSLACKLLFDTVTGDKSEAIENTDYSFSNIGAFKINDDTRKYIRDVFSMLRFRWGIYPLKLNEIWNVLKRNYDAECLTLFKSAFVYNAFELSNFVGENIFLQILLNTDPIRNKLKEFDKIYFWGFGPNTYCKELVDLFGMLDIQHPYAIWDKRYQQYQENKITNIIPIQPAPEKLSINDCVIATAKNRFMNNDIIATVANCDCENFFSIADLLEF